MEYLDDEYIPDNIYIIEANYPILYEFLISEEFAYLLTEAEDGKVIKWLHKHPKTAMAIVGTLGGAGMLTKGAVKGAVKGGAFVTQYTGKGTRGVGDMLKAGADALVGNKPGASKKPLRSAAALGIKGVGQILHTAGGLAAGAGNFVNNRKKINEKYKEIETDHDIKLAKINNDNSLDKSSKKVASNIADLEQGIANWKANPDGLHKRTLESYEKSLADAKTKFKKLTGHDFNF